MKRNYEGKSIETLKYYYLIIYWTQKVYNDFFFLYSLHCAAISFTVTRQFSFTFVTEWMSSKLPN